MAGRRAPRAGAPPAPPRSRRWAVRLVRNVVILVPVVAVVWTLLTPAYNVFLRHAAQRLVRLGEFPAVTRLQPADSHHLVLNRTDFDRGMLGELRTTDVHFPLVLLAALFLAVPGIPADRRWGNLGWATLVAVFFHIVSIFVWVKSVYALGLGDWSLAHYGAFGRNAWGLARHLLDLPFKLGLPVFLWTAFYLRDFQAALGIEPRPAATSHQM